MTGFDFINKMKNELQIEDVPIVVYTGRDLSQSEETQLRKYAETIIVKDVKSPERLLDETALFLHRVEAKLPDGKRRMLEHLHNADAVFAGKRVLLVDDHEDTRYVLRRLLNDHDVRTASSVSAALEEAALYDFDLLVLGSGPGALAQSGPTTPIAAERSVIAPPP